MDELIYGVWKGRAYDNRRTIDGKAPEGLPLSEFLAFNSGNPVAGFAGPQGFLMFDNRVTLADVLLSYYKRVRELACGRCTPCRAGGVMIVEALEAACEGRGSEVDWERIRDIALQMKETSLCGIGLTTPEPILGALEHFPELLVNAPVMPATQRDFISVATAPCIEACPAKVNVPRYIDYIRDGHPELATGVLLRHYPLVGSCGRVCVRPCETACARNHVDRPVAIKDLKRYAADYCGQTIEALFRNERVEPTPVSKRVAVIGAGPAGINCAYHLLRRGHMVDIYEEHAGAGGMARLGIPAYRLPNSLLETETTAIERMGGQYFFNSRFGRDFTLDSLFRRGYNAVFLGVGCALGQYLNLPGEDKSADGYLKGLDFLVDVEGHQSRGEPIELDGDVVVVGCGNVAMDCCRTARRLMKGGRVTVSYRRTRASAPADPEEIKAAMEEDIGFEFLTAPVSGDRRGRPRHGHPPRAHGRRRARRLGPPFRQARRGERIRRAVPLCDCRHRPEARHVDLLRGRRHPTHEARHHRGRRVAAHFARRRLRGRRRLLGPDVPHLGHGPGPERRHGDPRVPDDRRTGVQSAPALCGPHQEGRPSRQVRARPSRRLQAPQGDRHAVRRRARGQLGGSRARTHRVRRP